MTDTEHEDRRDLEDVSPREAGAHLLGDGPVADVTLVLMDKTRLLTLQEVVSESRYGPDEVMAALQRLAAVDAVREPKPGMVRLSRSTTGEPLTGVMLATQTQARKNRGLEPIEEAVK